MTFRIIRGMGLVSKRHGTTSVVVGATSSDYLVETDGYVANLNAAEIHEWFTPNTTTKGILMNANTETASTYWVCVDCYVTPEVFMVREDNGYARTDGRLTLIPAGAQVSPGLLWSEHADPDGCREAFELNAGCDCEHRVFSTTPCDGCGSTFAGTRDALTFWEA